MTQALIPAQQLKFSFQPCVVQQGQQRSRTTIKFNHNYMSSENDTSINVCLLVNIKEGGQLGLGMRGVSFIFTYFCFLTYSDSTLLTDMSSDIVQLSKSSGLAHIAPSACLLSFILQPTQLCGNSSGGASWKSRSQPTIIGGPLNQLFSCTASTAISYKAQSLLWFIADRLTDSHLVIGSTIEICIQVDRLSFSYWHKNRNLRLNYFVKKPEVFKGCKNQGLYIFLASAGGGSGLVCG